MTASGAVGQHGVCGNCATVSRRPREGRVCWEAEREGKAGAWR